MLNYQDENNFVYAGLRVIADQWVIGHYNGDFNDLVAIQDRIEPNQIYDIRVAVDESYVALVADGVYRIGHNFERPIGEGAIGLANQYAYTHFSQFHLFKNNDDDSHTVEHPDAEHDAAVKKTQQGLEQAIASAKEIHQAEALAKDRIAEATDLHREADEALENARKRLGAIESQPRQHGQESLADEISKAKNASLQAKSNYIESNQSLKQANANRKRAIRLSAQLSREYRSLETELGNLKQTQRRMSHDLERAQASVGLATEVAQLRIRLDETLKSIESSTRALSIAENQQSELKVKAEFAELSYQEARQAFTKAKHVYIEARAEQHALKIEYRELRREQQQAKARHREAQQAVARADQNLIVAAKRLSDSRAELARKTHEGAIAVQAVERAEQQLEQVTNGKGKPGIHVSTIPTDAVDSEIAHSENFNHQDDGAFETVRGQSRVAAGQMHLIADENDVAISVLDDESLPERTQTRMYTTVRSDAIRGRWYNGFVVFDFESPDNFKYAGAWAGANRWAIGEVVDGEFTDVTSVAAAIGEGPAYELQLWIEDDTATLLVDGQQKLTHAFDVVIDDGQLGVATKNAQSRFDQVAVMQLHGGSHADDAAKNGIDPAAADRAIAEMF